MRGPARRSQYVMSRRFSVQGNVRHERDGVVPWVLSCVAGLLLAMATLKASGLSLPWTVGSVALNAVFGLVVVGLIISLLNGRSPGWRGTGISIAWAGLIGFYGVGLLNSGNLFGLYRLVQVVLVFGVLLFTSSLRCSVASVHRFALVFGATVTVLWFAVVAFVGRQPGSILPCNANVAGLLSFTVVAVCTLGFVTGRSLFWRVIALAPAVPFAALLVMSRSRGIWMATALFCIVYLTYALFLRRRPIYTLCFVGMLASLTLFTYITVAQARSELAVEATLARVNESLTEKRLETRAGVWTPAIDAIWKHPWLGLGTGTQLGDVAETVLSAHSTYLEVGLQTGIPGMIAFVLVLYTIGYGLTKPTSEIRFGRFGCSLLLAVALQDGLASSLLGNSLPITVTVWGLWGLCLGLHLRGNGTAAIKTCRASL